MMRKIAIGTFLAALCLLVAGTASAISIGFDPAAVTGAVNDVVDVDIVVSDLGGEIVSAYDLDVVYDPSALTVLSVFQPTSSLGSPVIPEAFYDVNFGPGVIDLAGLSLLSDAELLSRQGGDSVVLATLTFQVKAAGTSQLSFVFDQFNDVKGLRAQPLELEVGGEPAIPEPGAALVFAVGATVMAAAIRRKS
jgi:hypothetical protein